MLCYTAMAVTIYLNVHECQDDGAKAAKAGEALLSHA